MSFILDALKKAESRRGQSPAMPVDTPLGDIASAEQPQRRGPLAMIALASSVLVIATLAWWLGRQSSAPAPMATASPPPALQLPVDEGNREIRPLDREADRSTRRAAPPPTQNETQREPAPTSVRATQNRSDPGNVSPAQPQVSVPPRSNENLPSYEELVLSGRVQLPALHLDIHVYADAPERRFVYLNNRKYRQGQQVEEGGQVERITPQGAVMNFRGHRFELKPD